MTKKAIGRSDLSDIQGIVLFSYSAVPDACYLHAFFPPEARPHAWLAGVLPLVTDSNRCAMGADRLNVAFTARGLARLGLDDGELMTFPRELLQGMGNPLRAHVNGDYGPNDPKTWEFGAPHQTELHAVLMLFSKDGAALAEHRAREAARLEAAGARVVHEDRGYAGPREHFGFADGIEQPHVMGSPRPRPSHADEVAAGEFVLGHENAYDEMPPSPRGKGGYDLGRNGSYLVYRKLAQDVPAFWRAMFDRATDTADPHVEQREAVALASKIVGRWPSGAPLVHHPDRDVGDAAYRRDFNFTEHDLDGTRCPLGAHIRRANPRDMLPPDAGASLKAVARHRLLRRGRSYGPRAPESLRERAIPDGVDRGLLFLAINASIRRQFEFIQQTWVNNPKFGGLYDERDPLVGNFEGPSQDFTVPCVPVRRRIQDLQQFVTTRGGGYFFVPGIHALGWLSTRAS